LFDDVGAKAFPIEFLGGALSTNIGGEKPNFISDGEFDAFVLSVVATGLDVLGRFDILDEGIAVSLEAFGVLLCGGILGVEVDAKMNAELGMVTVGSKEWRTFDRSLKGIVVRELGTHQHSPFQTTLLSPYHFSIAHRFLYTFTILKAVIYSSSVSLLLCR